jgi:arginine exporter protein ArgO
VDEVFGTHTFTPAQAGLFVLAVFTASASWQFLLVSGGALIGRVAGSRRGMLAISLASALLIAWLAARILTS